MLSSNTQEVKNLTEKNLIDLCIKATAVAKGEILKHDYYSWTKNPFYDWYSKVFNIMIPTKNLNMIIENLSKDIKEGNAPKCLLIGPTSSPKNVENHLINNNFTMIYQQTGMAIDLGKIDFENTLKPGTINTVRDEKELEKWLLTANEAFGKERNAEIFKRFLNETDITLYAYYDHGKLVSTTMLYKKESVAGIYLVGTLKDYRGKGFGTLLTKKVLMDAKKLGCDIGVLQASEMGKRIYQEIGFKEYCKISHWEYSG